MNRPSFVRLLASLWSRWAWLSSRRYRRTTAWGREIDFLVREFRLGIAVSKWQRRAEA